MYRIKQFIWAISAKHKPINKELLNEYLNRKEKRLFNKLDISEQHHSIRVCTEALHINKYIDTDTKKLAKIALLHDVGKSVTKLNIIDKSILVILDKVTKGNLKKIKNRKVDVYYNHPHKSVSLLKKIDKYDNDFIEAIENHHYKDIDSNKYLNIIRECDDRC